MGMGKRYGDPHWRLESQGWHGNGLPLLPPANVGKPQPASPSAGPWTHRAGGSGQSQNARPAGDPHSGRSWPRAPESRQCGRCTAPHLGGRVRGGGPSHHPSPMASASSHPPSAHPHPEVTHLHRCWQKDGWVHEGTAPAHFQHCGAPGGARAGGEGGRVSPGKVVPAPPPGSSHCVQLESGGG